MYPDPLTPLPESPPIFPLYTQPVFFPPSSISPHRQLVNVEDLSIRTTKKMCSASWFCESVDLRTAVWVWVSAPVLKHHRWNDRRSGADRCGRALINRLLQHYGQNEHIRWEITGESLSSDEHIEFPLFLFKNNLTILV